MVPSCIYLLYTTYYTTSNTFPHVDNFTIALSLSMVYTINSRQGDASTIRGTVTQQNYGLHNLINLTGVTLMYIHYAQSKLEQLEKELSEATTEASKCIIQDEIDSLSIAIATRGTL